MGEEGRGKRECDGERERERELPLVFFGVFCDVQVNKGSNIFKKTAITMVLRHFVSSMREEGRY